MQLRRGWTETRNRQKNKVRKPLSKLPGSISLSSWWEVFSECEGLNEFSNLHSASRCSDSSEALLPKPLCYTEEQGKLGVGHINMILLLTHTLLCQTGPFRRKSCWDLFLTEEVWGVQMTAWFRISFRWHACALLAFIFASKGRSNYTHELDLWELQVEGSLTSR